MHFRISVRVPWHEFEWSGVVCSAPPDPDVDLLIIEKELFSPMRRRCKEMFRLSKALRHLPVAKDIPIYSRAEFDYWQDSLNHVVGRASRDGRVLRAASISS